MLHLQQPPLPQGLQGYPQHQLQEEDCINQGYFGGSPGLLASSIRILNDTDNMMTDQYSEPLAFNTLASSWPPRTQQQVDHYQQQQQWRQLQTASPLSSCTDEPLSPPTCLTIPSNHHLFDQGYQSCSSPEQDTIMSQCAGRARRLTGQQQYWQDSSSLSDLETLSLEELRSFPATTLTRHEVEQLYNEQCQLGQTTVMENTQQPKLQLPKQSKPSSILHPCVASPKSRRNLAQSRKLTASANKQHQLLWQFLYAAATNPQFKDAIEMEDVSLGTFVIKDKRRFEEAWATFKGSQKKVRYDYITRNMRHLYRPPHHYLTKVVGQQHKYRFLYKNIEENYGTGWREAVPMKMMLEPQSVHQEEEDTLLEEMEEPSVPFCKVRSNSAPAPLMRRDSAVDIEKLLLSTLE